MPETTHPAVLVTAGFFCILILQRLEGAALVVALVPALLAGAAFARATWWRTLARLKYIFLALFVLFLWQTPGRLLLPALGNASPSVEGLALFAVQAGRLAGAVSLVALLLAWLDPAAWISALAAMLRPFEPLGLPWQRFVVRLRLVLEYAARRELDWRAILREPPDEGAGAVAEYEISGLAAQDRVWLLLVWAIGAGVLVWQG
ncbi:MAG: hypothetical protein REI09_08490 [Candidatus Dactylopiibacterium sp.]|nr:hypothetical protein [Candidatus Dactylopiibacterium sp.]